jgi:uncharacterized protein (TIGR04255 family)
MPAHEIFPNPVVKQVAFEVRFPSLFFIEGRIGDFQVQVMKDFPQSELVHRRNIMLVAGNPDNFEEVVKQQKSDSIDKIWQFKSASGTKLEVSTKNLVLTAENHLSYHQGEENAFRAVIDRVVARFFALVKIPVALRVGLRYINECPIFDRSTERFNACYNSILPLGRFGLENVVNVDCAVVANAKECQFRHGESLRLGPKDGQLILDLDASAENVPSEQVMARTDILHETISAEFKHTVKEPILDFMRKPKGNNL